MGKSSAVTKDGKIVYLIKVSSGPGPAAKPPVHEHTTNPMAENEADGVLSRPQQTTAVV